MAGFWLMSDVIKGLQPQQLLLCVRCVAW